MDSSYEPAPVPHFGVFCPDCPERNDLTDNAEISYCGDHRPSYLGDKDRVANPDGESWYPNTNSGEVDTVICDFIHRGKLKSDG